MTSLTTLDAQILYVKNGVSGIASISGNNVGINVALPQARLDINTDASTGGLQVRTNEGQTFGGYYSSPYALQVAHNSEDPNGNPQVAITMRLLPTGRLYLGSTNTYGYASANFLNVPRDGIGIFNTQSDFFKLTYGIVPGQRGARISWTSAGQSGNDKNFHIAYNTTSLMQVHPDGLVDVMNTMRAAKIEAVNEGTENEDMVLNVQTGMGNVFRVSNTGSVYIGPNLNGEFFEDYKLYVEKGIRAERIRVDIAADNGWADFVFDDDYELMPIAELQAYIKQHKHLPNVPSAEEVAEEGIDLAEMNAILLRQIEELTLRVIELEEKIEEQ